jgi:UDP-N-acetylmuramate-alanine ligase
MAMVDSRSEMKKMYAQGGHLEDESVNATCCEGKKVVAEVDEKSGHLNIV